MLKESQRNRTGTGEEFEVEQILCLIENMTPYLNKAVKVGETDNARQRGRTITAVMSLKGNGTRVKIGLQ